MARYTPEFLASVRHDVEETDLPLPLIANKHAISLRTLYRLNHRKGWRKRSEQLHDLPPAARLLNAATALLTERGKAQQDACSIRHPEERAERASASRPWPTCAHETQSRVNPRLAGDGPHDSTACGPHPSRAASRPPQDDGDSSNTGPEVSGASPIDRLERLVEKELDAEEAVRAQLGPLPRNPADAERTARTLSTLTQTLHALQRLRSGLGFQSHDDDDDMPRDIDEFRRELARRIRAFVASRTGRADAGGDPGPRMVDAAR